VWRYLDGWPLGEREDLPDITPRRAQRAAVNIILNDEPEG
jgi:hypothetical protein